MNSPSGIIYVEETIENQRFTFYLGDMILGTTDDIEKWSTIVVSTNGEQAIGMINRK